MMLTGKRVLESTEVSTVGFESKLKKKNRWRPSLVGGNWFCSGRLEAEKLCHALRTELEKATSRANAV